MISYPFISQLFKNVLTKSKTIQGRFYVCPKMGNEINSDLLGEVLQQVNPGKEYPLVLMMPPRARTNFQYNANKSLTFNITLFFLKTTYYGTGNTLNEFTGTSTHTIEEDWNEMIIAANSFLNALMELQKLSFYKSFTIGSNMTPFQPVSNIGLDRASGIRVDFEIYLPIGCEPLDGYELGDIKETLIPV